jgi:Zn-dependent protease
MRYWFPLGRTRWFHAALHVHLSVIVAVAVVALTAAESPAFAIVTLISLIALILLHEFGHAAVAHHFGYRVQSIWFSLFHGRCVFDAPTDEWERCLIAWGGVVAQLLVAIPLLALDSFVHPSPRILGPVVLILGYWSLVLIILNLIPSGSLDGATAWRIIPLLRRRVKAGRIAHDAILRNRRGR